MVKTALAHTWRDIKKDVYMAHTPTRLRARMPLRQDAIGLLITFSKLCVRKVTHGNNLLYLPSSRRRLPSPGILYGLVIRRLCTLLIRWKCSVPSPLWSSWVPVTGFDVNFTQLWSEGRGEGRPEWRDEPPGSPRGQFHASVSDELSSGWEQIEAARRAAVGVANSGLTVSSLRSLTAFQRGSLDCECQH